MKGGEYNVKTTLRMDLILTIISIERPTYMTFKKKSPQELVCLSESGHLFQCLLQLKYTKILSLIHFTSLAKQSGHCDRR